MTIEAILERMRAIIDSSDAEGRSLSDEEVTEYETLETDLEKARKDVEVRARQKAYETPAFLPNLKTGGQTQEEEHMRAFDRYLRTGDKAILAEFRAQSVGVDAEGGFTVPEVFRQKLVDRLLAFGGVAAEVETITTSGGEDMRWPTLDDTANRGVIATEGTAPASGGADLVFGEITLGAFRYVAPGAGNLPLRVSVELLQDSAFDIQSLVQRKLGERIARAQATHWVTGNGTTEPFGLDTGTNTSAHTAAVIDKDALIDSLHDVDPAYRAKAVWTFSDGTLAQIRKLEDTTGRPLLQDFASSGIGGGMGGFTLLGHRVVIDQAWPNYTDGVVQDWGAFGDLREGYVIRRVRDVQLIVNPFSRANEGQVEFTMWARADGNVQNPNAFTVMTNAL